MKKPGIISGFIQERNDMDKDQYPAETAEIVKLLDDIYDDMRERLKYVNVDTGNFQAKDIDVLHFMVCLAPDSMCYGRGIGAFIYKDGRVFQFSYNIHTPHSKGPRLSNRMTNIQRVTLHDCYGVMTTRNKNTDFGLKAFWDYTPISALDDESASLRELMKSVQSYCRKENLCARLRKTDKEHEKWENKKFQMEI